MSEWISVKDRLPEAGTMVLAGDRNWVEQALYDGTQFLVHWGRYDETPAPWVTHWMPLPDPPKDDV